MKNLLLILFIIVLSIFIFPLAEMDSRYVITNQTISCDKSVDKCKIFLKNTGIKLKEFKISEVKELYSQTVYVSKGTKCYCHNCLQDKDNSCLREVHRLFLLTKDNTNIFVSGLIARDVDDEYYKKFQNYIEDKSIIKLNYSINNFDMHMQNVITSFKQFKDLASTIWVAFYTLLLSFLFIGMFIVRAEGCFEDKEKQKKAKIIIDLLFIVGLLLALFHFFVFSLKLTVF